MQYIESFKNNRSNKVIKMIQKVLIDPEGEKLYWSQGDLHTRFGVIKEKEIKNGVVKSHLGKEFLVYEANFVDKVDKIKRGPAVIVNKDIGLILANTGVNAKSKILEAGSGSGRLTAFLANISNNVTSYEHKKEIFELAQKNLKDLELKVKIKNKDIYEGIEEKNLDVIILDLAEPWRVLTHAEKALKCGGCLVAYLPNITQVVQLIKSLTSPFILDKAEEVIEREWIIDDRVRPVNQILGHTAFLVFIRKI